MENVMDKLLKSLGTFDLQPSEDGLESDGEGEEEVVVVLNVVIEVVWFRIEVEVEVEVELEFPTVVGRERELVLVSLKQPSNPSPSPATLNLSPIPLPTTTFLSSNPYPRISSTEILTSSPPSNSTGYQVRLKVPSGWVPNLLITSPSPSLTTLTLKGPPEGYLVKFQESWDNEHSSNPGEGWLIRMGSKGWFPPSVLSVQPTLSIVRRRTRRRDRVETFPQLPLLSFLSSIFPRLRWVSRCLVGEGGFLLLGRSKDGVRFYSFFSLPDGTPLPSR
ncbi:hypothetical protein IE53DRAFT_282349 [Violaceomyces palustris]|uniref:Uncharacterized protein n=1 Tax=Violaceomyces palustris TaxID=1673888 RepID=A0ACD0NMD0_9BASI|nr:hypothetical protein IE53DRAFT_282349 [Violaceomyces palustris]